MSTRPRGVDTAHGKVILFGEHAVVYGVPALAVGIDRGAWAEATPAEGAASTLTVRGLGLRVRDDGPSSESLVRAFRDVLQITRDAERAAGLPVTPAVDVVMETELPPGGGLGCSAAMGVALARALAPSASGSEIATRAAAWERVFHGNPSGIDAAVASLGGAVFFERASEVGAAPRIERVRLPLAMHLCVGHSGSSSSTKTMVEAVARLRERRPEVTDKAFAAIHTLVRNARLALEAGDLRAVGQLLDLNQMLLAGLFVSTPEIEQMCASARAASALGAKLTGAGGGGCVVALVQDEPGAQAVLEAWRAVGFDGFSTTVGGVPRSASRAAVVAAAPAETAP